MHETYPVLTSDDTIDNMAAAPKQKHPRAPPFSFREVEVLTNEMKIYAKDLERDHESGGEQFLTRQKQIEIWVEIAKKVNAIGKCPRTIDQIKEKWRNMVNNHKTKHLH